ncbi:TPA: hypothetical protein ACGUTO_004425 [Vibrio vulnificus]
MLRKLLASLYLIALSTGLSQIAYANQSAWTAAQSSLGEMKYLTIASRYELLGKYSQKHSDSVALIMQCTYSPYSRIKTQRYLSLGDSLIDATYTTSTSNGLVYNAKVITEPSDLKAALNSNFISIKALRGSVILHPKTIKPALHKYQTQIANCERAYNASYQQHMAKVKSKDTKRMMILGAMVLGGLLTLFLTVKLLKYFVLRFKSKVHQFKVSITTASENLNRKKLVKKAQDSAIDEAVRLAVRAEASKVLSSEDIYICPTCEGKKCDYCDHKGWLSR